MLSFLLSIPGSKFPVRVGVDSVSINPDATSSLVSLLLQ